MYKDLVSERIVVPVDVYQLDDNLYMRAYCLTARDYREFRVDRIEQATPESVAGNFEPDTSDSEKIRFSLAIKEVSRDASERFAIATMEIDTTIELSSFSKQWIERSVMASGGAVLLRAPLEIRAEVAKKAQLMLNRYKEA
jgi:proteasome accessory factor C